ncbi:hypothetical protein ColLi_07222 [Colletotrichum liriopes]|uniref:Uncharacterized protein n=1 Tax=Colletotrichum liriopes TaxID=708192 RepID=A0AA37LTK4_9PEZI|nr:hypothetical protein ColLi_07222 [Colletotrichum liriopes]
MKGRQKRKPVSQLMGGGLKRKANNIRESRLDVSTTVAEKTTQDLDYGPTPMGEPGQNADSILCKGSVDEQLEDGTDLSEISDTHEMLDVSVEEKSQPATKGELSEALESIQEILDSLPTSGNIEALLNKELSVVRSKHNNLKNEFQEQHKSLRDEVQNTMDTVQKLTEAKHDTMSAGLKETQACVGTLSTSILSLQVESSNSKKTIEGTTKQMQSDMDNLRENILRKTHAQMEALREEISREKNEQITALREEMTRMMEGQMTAFREEMTKQKEDQMEILRGKNALLEREMNVFKASREQDVKVLREHVTAYLERNKTLVEDSNELRVINKVLGQDNEAIRMENEALRKTNEEHTERIKALTDWNSQTSVDFEDIRRAFAANNQAIQRDLGGVRGQVDILTGKLQGFQMAMAQGFQGLGNMFMDKEDPQTSAEGTLESTKPPQAQHWDQQYT